MLEKVDLKRKLEKGTFKTLAPDLRERLGEIADIEEGKLRVEDSPLKNAPHPAAVLIGDKFPYSYSREQAVFPVAGLRTVKYFPPVGRVDNVYGDRHLVCACLPMSAYDEASDYAGA